MHAQSRLQAWVSVLSLGLLFTSLLLSAPSAIAQPPAADTEDFAAPELLYLTWQEEHPREPDGKYFPVWKPDGERLSDEASLTLRKQVNGFAVFNERDSQLHPLILIFKLDPRAETTPVMPKLLSESGPPLALGGSQNSPAAGMILSSLAPEQRELLLWPEQGSVEIRYPLENPTVVKTIAGPPQGRIEIAEGVTWELDPNYAMELDPQTRRYVRAENKFAGVLITNSNDADPNVDYAVRIELAGGKIIKTVMHTAKSNPTGEASSLDVTPAVDGPQQITKLFVVRQRHALKTFKDLPIKRDLMRPTPEQEKRDE